MDGVVDKDYDAFSRLEGMSRRAQNGNVRAVWLCCAELWQVKSFNTEIGKALEDFIPLAGWDGYDTLLCETLDASTYFAWPRVGLHCAALDYTSDTDSLGRGGQSCEFVQRR